MKGFSQIQLYPVSSSSYPLTVPNIPLITNLSSNSIVVSALGKDNPHTIKQGGFQASTNTYLSLDLSPPGTDGSFIPYHGVFIEGHIIDLGAVENSSTVYFRLSFITSHTSNYDWTSEVEHELISIGTAPPTPIAEVDLNSFDNILFDVTTKIVTFKYTFSGGGDSSKITKGIYTLI